MSSEASTAARPLEGNVIERRQQRTENATKRKEGLDEMKDQGNELFKKGDYSEAAKIYVGAIQKFGRKPVLLSNLAMTLSRLEKWTETEYVATLALQSSPMNIKARFRRAMARKSNRQYQAALVDLSMITAQDPRCIFAEEEYMRVDYLFDRAWDYELDEMETSESDCAWPGPDEQPDDFDSDSDTSDCGHQGNGVPCRFYNHGGCKRKESCAFSHSPDNKSVRDELGRNVCVYFLTGKCKFGERKCVYSHEKSYLPSGGWWEDKTQCILAQGMSQFVTENSYWGMRSYHDFLRGSPGRRGIDFEKDFILKHLREACEIPPHTSSSTSD